MDDHYQKMLKTYGSLTSWQAEIVQANVFGESHATLHSTGSFYYQKGKICIRYKKPNEQYLLVKDGKVTIYDRSANTAVRTSLASSIQSLNPVDIIKSYWGRSKRSIKRDSGFTVSLSLKPYKDEQIREIQFDLDKETGYVIQLTYFDHQDNVVNIVFNKIKINPDIPASVWKLPIPPDVKIMEF